MHCKTAHPHPTGWAASIRLADNGPRGIPLPPQPHLCDEQKMQRDRRDHVRDKHSCESQREYRIRDLTGLILMSPGIIPKAIAKLFEQARAKFCNLPYPKLREIVEEIELRAENGLAKLDEAA